MPLTFLSGVFYSIHSLPAFWQGVSHFNPFFYMIDGFRYGFFGVSDVDAALSASRWSPALLRRAHRGDARAAEARLQTAPLTRGSTMVTPEDVKTTSRRACPASTSRSPATASISRR